MMNKILCACLCIISLNVAAKPKSIGIQGGLNYSKFSSPIKLTPGLASNFGITIQKYRNKYVFFETGLALDQNAVINKIITDNQGNIITDAEAKFTTKYISIPLIVGFKSGGKVYFYTKLGITPSMFVSINQKNNIDNPSISTYNFTYAPSLKFSPNAEVGIGKMFGNRMAITFGTKINYQLFSIYSNTSYFSDGSIFYKSLGLNLGVHYFINKID